MSENFSMFLSRSALIYSISRFFASVWLIFLHSNYINLISSGGIYVKVVKLLIWLFTILLRQLSVYYLKLKFRISKSSIEGNEEAYLIFYSFVI